MCSAIQMGGPVCLILNTPEGHLKVNPEALNILSKISQPVVVVAIVGLYRTGKSYLMNKLSGERRGFALGATIQAQTKGIWMWCVPHPTKLDHTMVLLDTEGLGDVHKGDKKNDIWIFCLAVLLSSALVYNSMGTIDQDAIDKLHYVTELTDRVKVKSIDNDDGEEEFSKHFPIFIWTVRDFNLKLEIDGKTVNEDDYLENALRLKQPEKNLSAQNYNFPRKCIHMYFGSRKCFVFDCPADKDALQVMEEIPDNKLRPAFVAQTEKFCDFVFKNAGVKQLDGIYTVTGTILGNLAKTYTETITRGEVPCMENAVLSLSEIENTEAVQEASEYYEQKMKERVEFPTETMKEFMDLSGECEKQALEIFMKKSFKDEAQKFQKRFMETIQQKKHDFCKQNEMASQTYCQTLIEEHAKDLERAIAEGSYSAPGGHQLFKKALSTITEKYNQESRKGTEAEQVLQDFLKSKESIGMVILKSDNALSEKEKEIEEEKANTKAREMEERVCEEKKLQENLRIKDQSRTLEENITRLMEKIEMERRKMNDTMDRIMFEKRREQEAFEQQRSFAQAQMYKAQIDDLKKEREANDESDWYLPILAQLKDVAKEILPEALSVGGDIVKDKIKNYREGKKKLSASSDKKKTY